MIHLGLAISGPVKRFEALTERVFSYRKGDKVTKKKHKTDEKTFFVLGFGLLGLLEGRTVSFKRIYCFSESGRMVYCSFGSGKQFKMSKKQCRRVELFSVLGCWDRTGPSGINHRGSNLGRVL